MTKSDPYPHNQSRKDLTAQKLREALHRLATNAAIHPDNAGRSAPFSVSALAREAGVARNAIYTNHRFALTALVDLKSEKSPLETSSHELNQAIQKLATENALLSKRAIDAENRAERLERRCASLLKQKDDRLSVVNISKPQTEGEKLSSDREDSERKET